LLTSNDTDPDTQVLKFIITNKKKIT